MTVEFLDVSNWNEQFWLNSGGTRAKKILQDHAGDLWFFKCSEKKPAKEGKPAKYYRYEFWSEVIAYQLGNDWGLNVLRYDPAVFNDEIGCISRSMHKTGDEQLLELGRFMTALSSDFIPDDKKTRNQYTFQLLAETLDYFELTQYWENFFQTLLFDAVIGNTDRHQENWAFIGRSTVLTRSLDDMEKDVREKPALLDKWLIRTFFGFLFDRKKKVFKQETEQIRLKLINLRGAAPIYDNGSSMARELEDERVQQLLENEQLFTKYVDGGLSELHWANKKLSHFDNIEKMLDCSYLEEVQKAGRFLEHFQANRVREIVQSIDNSVPDAWAAYRIPQSRKELIIKLITLRAEKIRRLLS
ncbi:HipA domain-containing protein [Sediminibacterium sp.]|uniref:HipA domain-containing protein n=1 Tax=Sediminibacterium sp. TaxID=1917865 RepID=UPI0025DC474F|nr:HipA domain-containing protein [Sediminibacterium sp.]MBT9485568.1 HipA domain-containing protein [Sediminibacterium sp.]